MGNLYRRDGSPYADGELGIIEWSADINNPKIRLVANTELDNGVTISTIWVGIDFAPGVRGGSPGALIFETKIYPKSPWKSVPGGQFEYESMPIGKTERYATEEEAKKGHRKKVMEVVELFNGAKLKIS